MSDREYEISIVLNVHDEWLFLRRTLRSLEDAALYCARFKIRCELVVVLDRSGANTRNFIEGYDYSLFAGHQIISVDNGSLGLSRRDGIAVAKADYIATADADDLVSYNAFFESYLLASDTQDKRIFIAEYLCAFGEKRNLWRMFGSDTVSNLTLFEFHPYLSRIFAHRRLFLEVSYAANDAKQGYAFEDWHFNTEAISNGWRFTVVPDTVLFYRRRADGLLRASKEQNSIIAPTSYFDPPRYLRLGAASAAIPPDRQPALTAKGLKAQMLDSPLFAEFLRAANRIEPAINIHYVQKGSFGSNTISYNDKLGRAYYQLCKMVGSATFTDVVLLPFLSPGGAEKYMLQVMNGLKTLDPQRRFLVLCGQKFESHSWIERLPAGTIFADLFPMREDQTAHAIELLTLRIIQATAPTADVHIKPCQYAMNFVKRHHHRLSGNTFNFYYFSDTRVTHQNGTFVVGENFDFISNAGHRLDRIISDHQDIGPALRERIDLPESKFVTLYAGCNVRPRKAPAAVGLKKRLLWASRLAPEKRPELLMQIAGTLARLQPDLKIEVYGAAVSGGFDVEAFEGYENIVYRGAYSNFDDIDASAYDAFLYTTKYDGMPNVVLEALSAGLPVIAPDVGGIKEAVSDKTGILIADNGVDEELLSAYVKAVESIYKGGLDLAGRSDGARAYIASRHSDAAHLKRVAEIFGISG